MRLVQWLRQKDPGFLALRRAARTAIVMPALFAICTQIIDNPQIATFAAFGAFAMLLLADFGGPMHERVQAQVALGVTGAVLVAIGTLASRNPWLAAAAMALVGFGVLFAGVVSSVLAGAAPSLLLAFILPAATKAPTAAVPDRMAGWGMAAAASLVAITLLWPAPAHFPIRAQAVTACRALAARLRADIDYRLSSGDPATVDAHTEAVAAANAAVAALHKTFLATPYRPTGLSTPARTVIRLIDEINWLNMVVVKASPKHMHKPVNASALEVKRAAALVLERGADLLAGATEDRMLLEDAVVKLRGTLDVMEQDATINLPVQRVPASALHGASTSAPTDGSDEQLVEVVSSLDPSFRAQELTFAVGQIAANIDRTIAAERRTWVERFLGRQPAGLPGTLAAAQERASAHIERHSVWLHNSIRGAVALAVAIFVANETGVQHSFWVVLGTLSVLRSNALNTGQNIVRGLVGTTIGFVIGAALVVPMGTNTTPLWIILPVAILVAGVAPAAISFAAGQAAFTVTLLVLFNIIAPVGWRVGIVRIEDVAIGAAVSLLVGLLFWPRGAAAALGVALAEAYADSVAYLCAAVQYGVSRCDRDPDGRVFSDPSAAGLAAAAAARRLDDTFRTYLAERGAKPMPVAELTGLLTGVASLRLAADAIVELWRRDRAEEPGDRAAARRELLSSAGTVQSWFGEFAGSLASGADVPAPSARDEVADGRLIEAVRSDLSGRDGLATATAVRVIWTGDHLDAVRRLEDMLVTPAQTAIERGGIATPNYVLRLPGARPAVP